MKAGRKPAYASPEELQVKITEYFEKSKPEFARTEEGDLAFDKYGSPIILNYNFPTVCGLALHLGFVTRQALINYQARPLFVDVVSRAKLRIEQEYEQRLSDPRLKPQGPIFALQNMGWKDTKELNHTGKDGGAFIVQISKELEDV